MCKTTEYSYSFTRNIISHAMGLHVKLETVSRYEAKRVKWAVIALI